jgi:hypothetical protein
MAPTGREFGDDAQAVTGLGQISRTVRLGCGPAPRTVVDDRDAGRGAAPPDQDLEPAARATNRRACLTWSGWPGKTRRRGPATSRAPCPAGWIRVPAGADEDIRASKLVGREVVAPARFSLSAYGALGRAHGQRTGLISRRACRAR